MGGVKILDNLDNRTLCVARLVCEDWRKFIDAQLLWWNRIIEGCHLRLSPDWIKIITNIKAKRTKPDDIKTTGAILQDFFATSFPSSIFETLLTPYYVSVWNGNLSH